MKTMNQFIKESSEQIQEQDSPTTTTAEVGGRTGSTTGDWRNWSKTIRKFAKVLRRKIRIGK